MYILVMVVLVNGFAPQERKYEFEDITSCHIALEHIEESSPPKGYNGGLLQHIAYCVQKESK